MKKLLIRKRWQSEWWQSVKPVYKLVMLYAEVHCDSACFWHIEQIEMWARIGQKQANPTYLMESLPGCRIAGTWIWLEYAFNELYPDGLSHDTLAHKTAIKQLDEQRDRFDNLPVPSAHDGDANYRLKTGNELAGHLMRELTRVHKRKYVSGARSGGREIAKLLKAGVSADEVRAAIAWLVGQNLQNEFKFVVQSGNALRAKWDRIQDQMQRDGCSGGYERVLHPLTGQPLPMGMKLEDVKL